MSKRTIALFGLTGGLLALVSVGALVRAWKHQPDFYQTALNLPEPEARQLSERLLERLGALSGSVNRSGPWKALVSSDEVNGWLATDFAENLSETLPANLQEPRVQIERDRVRLGCRYGHGWSATVVHLEVEPFQVARDAVGLRIRTVKAGALPAPLGGLLEAITHAAQNAGWQLAWEQAGACPTAILRPDLRRRDGTRQELEAVSLVDGKLYLAGRTIRPGQKSGAEETAGEFAAPATPPAVATQEGRQEARQR